MEGYREQGPKMLGREGWVARAEIPVERDYYEFQLEFAKAVATAAEIPLINAIRGSTPNLGKYVATTLEPISGEAHFINNVDEHNIVDFAYKRGLVEARKTSMPYREGGRFGCFSYDLPSNDKGTVRIHFQNTEFDPASGPLDPTKLPQRRAEIGDLFRTLHSHGFRNQVVNGCSWLYGVDRYRAVYPEAYTRDREPHMERGAWTQGSMIWGQFLNSDGKLHTKRAELLLERVRTQPKSGFMYELLDPPLLVPMRVQAPIETFYKEYEIS